MTNTQKKYYRAILEKNFSFLTKGGMCVCVCVVNLFLITYPYTCIIHYDNYIY